MNTTTFTHLVFDSAAIERRDLYDVADVADLGDRNYDCKQ
jgi:hypothetical protein